jgi:hypothetical protein
LQFTWMCFSLSKICLSVFATWGTQPSKMCTGGNSCRSNCWHKSLSLFLHWRRWISSWRHLAKYVWHGYTRAVFITSILKKFWRGEKVDSVSQFH